jgi:hypothetical protein
MEEMGFIFGGLLNKKNKRRLLTQTEKKKRLKKRKRKQSREGLRFHDQRATEDEGKRERKDRARMMQDDGGG